MARTRTVTKFVEDEVDDAAAAEGRPDPNEGVTIFGDLDDPDAERRIEKVQVRRLEPDEGVLGELDARVTLLELREKFGGGKFRLDGKNVKGQIKKVETVSIAGDPIFQSEVYEAKWRRANGLPPRAHGNQEQVSMKDILVLIEERDRKRAEDEERRRREERELEKLRRDEERALERERIERERREREDREEKLRRDAQEREERLRKEALEIEERRARQAREDEERRTRQHREDMERMKAEQQALMNAQQQMFAQTLQLVKADAARPQNDVETLIKGITLAKELGGAGGEPPDLLTTLLGRAPELLSELRQTASAAVHEIRGGGEEAGGEGASEEELVVKGPMAAKLKAIQEALIARGQDPEKAIDVLMRMVAAKRAAAAEAAPRAPQRKPKKGAVKRARKAKGKPAPLPPAPGTQQAPRRAAAPAAPAAPGTPTPRAA